MKVLAVETGAQCIIEETLVQYLMEFEVTYC